MQEVLDDGMEGKVREGRKEGEWESFGGVYIITESTWERISNGRKEYR